MATHLAVAAPPGIIFPVEVYFFSVFFPFAEEGAALELRGVSEPSEGPAGASGVAVGRESGSAGVSGMVCVTTDPGSVAGGGGNAPEEGADLGAVRVSTTRDGVVALGEGADSQAVMLMGEERAACVTRGSLLPELSVGCGISSGTLSNTANGVVFGVSNTSAL